MSYVPVDLVVQDAVSNRPVEGVLVKVFAEDGRGVYGEMVTGTDGKASFLLDGPRRYQARAFKLSTGFKNPIYFDVLDAPATNCFNIIANTISPPSSTDPRLCMCSGTFRTPTGGPAAGLNISFVTRFHPLILDHAGVLTERISAITDRNGWVQLPLIRNGEFDVFIEGYEDVKRIIQVPDASSCNLPDLIFEVVDHVVIGEQQIQIALGQTAEIIPEVFTSTGRKLDGTAKSEVSWKVDDLNVASMTVLWDKIVLYGNTAGAALLTAERADMSIVRIPDPPLMSGIPILVA